MDKMQIEEMRGFFSHKKTLFFKVFIGNMSLRTSYGLLIAFTSTKTNGSPRNAFSANHVIVWTLRSFYIAWTCCIRI